MIQKLPSKKPFIFSTICLLIVLLSGSLTLFWQVHLQHSSKAIHQATSGSIIGVPTLPAATIDKIFAQMGSPMVGTGSVVEQAARQANIDDAFALGVWWTETNDGAAGVGRADRNPGSVRGSYGYPAAYDGYTIYPSYAAAITDWFNVLKSRYVSRGLISVYTLCYPYVGTSSAPLWAAKVVNLMYRYRGQAPPVTATPTPKPTATQATSPQAPINVRARQLATRLAQLPDNTGSPDSTTPVQIQQQPVQQVTAPSSPPTTLPFPVLPLVCFGLLAALAIALAGLRIGRGTTISASGIAMDEILDVIHHTSDHNAALAGTRLFAPTTAPQPQYAPVTEALSPFFSQEQEQVPQLDFPSVPSIYQPTLFQQFSSEEEDNTPIPASPVPQQIRTSIPDLPTLPVPSIARKGGLLKRYGTTETLGPRVVLSPSRLQPLSESEEEPSPHTETLRERVPVPLASGGRGGLLQRYTQQ